MLLTHLPSKYLLFLKYFLSQSPIYRYPSVSSRYMFVLHKSEGLFLDALWLNSSSIHARGHK